MNRIADHLEKNIMEIATIESTDNGKPIHMACFDIGLGVKTLRYMAGWTDKIQGRTLPMVGPF
jgi:aldehyde dehydrogenase (NAD+)